MPRRTPVLALLTLLFAGSPALAATTSTAAPSAIEREVDATATEPAVEGGPEPDAADVPGCVGPNCDAVEDPPEEVVDDPTLDPGGEEPPPGVEAAEPAPALELPANGIEQPWDPMLDLEAMGAIDTSTGPPVFDIPMVEHETIGRWMSYFTGRGRQYFESWLSRMPRFAPLFRLTLHRHELPRDLIFLSMIESGFSTRAYSWAHASGPWQFIPETGRRYGLEIGFWQDDRRDFERSTDAAALYLKSLYDEFKDWNLAWAAYNCGENRVRWAVRRTGTTDFWKMAKTRALPRESRQYVPKLLAAAVLAKQPERYGFSTIEPLQPYQWEVATVTVATDLATIAKACGGSVTEAQVRELNPALYRGITPPGKAYDVRVPRGSKAACTEGLRLMPPEERRTYRFHQVRRGDTVQSLAKQFHTTPEAITELNKAAGTMHLSAFDAIIIPLPLSESAAVPMEEPPARWRGGPPSTPDGKVARVHRVRKGDSLWTIAKRYGVSVTALRAWNGLWRGAKLRVGQAIQIAGR